MSYILAFYLAYFPTFYLAYILAFYVGYFLALYLAHILACILGLYPAHTLALSGALSDTFRLCPQRAGDLRLRSRGAAGIRG